MSGSGPMNQVVSQVLSQQPIAKPNLPNAFVGGQSINPMYTQQTPTNSFAPMQQFQQFKQTGQLPQPGGAPVAGASPGAPTSGGK